MDLLQRSHTVHHTRSSSSSAAASPGTANDRTVVSALLSDNLQSPNAIPPRTSSSNAALFSTFSSFGSPVGSTSNTNGDRQLRPSKRASTSVLRPISERDWLSQGRRVSQELLGRQKSEREKDGVREREKDKPKQSAALTPASPPRMNSNTNTLSGASREQADAAPPSSPPQHPGSPSNNPMHKVQMVDVAPQRKSSRHKPSTSTESNGVSAAQASQRSPLSPPPPPEKLLSLTDDLIHNRRQQPWSSDKERILLGPYAYLLGHPGKDIRAQLIAAFNEWLKVPEQSLTVITKVIGMLHTSSLLVDDVEDSSQLRRGVPVAHSIFGTAQTINSANYVYFLALQELNALPSAQHAIQIYTSELINLHRGQGLDLFWRDTLTCPTEADYLEMVGNKTGGLFRLAIRLMQAESRNADVDCVALVNTIGLLFQILDDHLNLSSSLYTARKGLCEDLTEGKFSFPVVHAIRTDPKNLTLINILRQKTTDDEVKRYAVRYMEKCGSFQYSKDVLELLKRKAEEEVSELELRVGVSDAEAANRGAESMRKILERLKVDQ